ncbi:sugar phosphate nucleotidyltransferase [Paludibaculum fermentans]|uniref:sugar phosphate nucleotidyltransferase n=1 Tax=Paludibaculum fermentans TaxID=1473598 RepID=UPI003EB88D9E
MPSRSLLILAGGRGTRLQNLHPDLPKPMVPVAGQPFLEWMLRFWEQQGAGDVVVSTGYLAEVIEDFLKARGRGVTVKEREALGTGGAVRFAVEQQPVSDPFVVTNGDSLVAADLSGMWDLPPGVEAAIVALEVDDASRFGTLAIDEAGFLQRFEEKRPGAGWINAGIYCFRRHLIDAFPPGVSSMEMDVFPSLLAAGVPIRVIRVSGRFLDIGTPSSLVLGDAFVQELKGVLPA